MLLVFLNCKLSSNSCTVRNSEQRSNFFHSSFSNHPNYKISVIFVTFQGQGRLGPWQHDLVLDFALGNPACSCGFGTG